MRFKAFILLISWTATLPFLAIGQTSPQARRCEGLFSATPLRRPLPFYNPGISSPAWARRYSELYQASLSFPFGERTEAPVAHITNVKERLRLAYHGPGIAITGDQEYPLDFVMRNLRMDQDFLLRLRRQDKILSVAEGQSELAPSLDRRGLDVVAVDLAYAAALNANKNRSEAATAFSYYVNEYSRFLRAADATELPFESGSFTLVLNHFLLNNLATEEEEADFSVQEMVRVAAPGGQVRIAIIDPDGNVFSELFSKLAMVPWLKVTRSHFHSFLHNADGARQVGISLIVIDKSLQAPQRFYVDPQSPSRLQD